MKRNAFIAKMTAEIVLSPWNWYGRLWTRMEAIPARV